MKNELSMYRIYGEYSDGQIFDDYCEASTAQKAVDRVREWRSCDEDELKILEVSKVLKSGWK